MHKMHIKPVPEYLTRLISSISGNKGDIITYGNKANLSIDTKILSKIESSYVGNTAKNGIGLKYI